MNQEKHIPTILGLILLICATAFGVYITGKKTILNTKAGGDCHPVNIQITNTTHNASDIFFTTTDSCYSSILIDNRTVSDVRSAVSGQPNTQTKLHYFSIDNLKENNNYVFSVISGGKNYSSDTYKLKTAAKPVSPLPTSNLAWGKIYESNGSTPASGAIILISIPGASPLSAITTAQGNWNISLAVSLNDTKTDWFKPHDNISEDIIVLTDNDSPTQLTGNTTFNNPVPNIIIGNNQLNFPNMAQTGNLTVSGPPHSGAKPLTIDNPTDGEALSSSRPDFFGSSTNNSQLDIKVESSVAYSGKIVSGQDGTWHWSPPSDLAPGEHTITVTSRNPVTGLMESVSRKFTVLASDSPLSFTASGSATPVPPTSIPTNIPTLSPTVIPTPTPTIYLGPTARPTKIPKSTPTSVMPVTGFDGPTAIMVTMSALMVCFAFLIFK